MPCGSPSPSDRRRRFARLCAGAALACAAPACAVDLQVYPIRFELGAQTPTGVLTVVNRGSDDTLFQLSVQQWAQSEEVEDILTPTRDVLANPGVFLLKGNAQQVARFGLRVSALPVERSYRIILQEVPRQASTARGLMTLLRVSIPIFVPPPNPVKKVDWRLRAAKGGGQLIVANGGNVHVEVNSIGLTAGGQSAPITLSANSYVLPGKTRAIRFDTKTPIVPGTSYELRIESDQGPFSATVRAEPEQDAQPHN